MIRKSKFVFLMVLGFSCFSQEKPNIIFILTDDQSPFPVLAKKSSASRPFGFNGDSRVHTPVIDSLAKNGIIFTRAYVSSSVCAPSRYSLLTGRYAGRCEGTAFLQDNPTGKLSRVGNNTELEQDKGNIATYLKEAGYLTGFVGKSHIADHRNVGEAVRSLDGTDLKNYPRTADPKDEAIIEATRYNQNFWNERIKELGFDYAQAIYAANLRELFNDSLNVHNIEWKNKAVLDFIDQAGDQPFFMYYSETVPHGPAPWRKRKGKYVHGLDANPKFTGAGYVDVEFDNMPTRKSIQQEVESLSGKDPDQAWLRWLDRSVESIVKKLEEKGKLDNTLIVVMSDHGDRLNGKATNYEDGVRVPLMIFWPKGIKKGQVYDELVQNIDFVPTFLDLAGIDCEGKELDGVSLKKVLMGDQDPVHDYLFFEMGYSRAVMSKEWKYIALRYDQKTQKRIEAGERFKGWRGEKIDRPYYVKNVHLGHHSALNRPNYFDPDQLYDLQQDSRETVNLANTKPEKTIEMKAVLTDFLRSFSGRPYDEFTEDN